MDPLLQRRAPRKRGLPAGCLYTLGWWSPAVRGSGSFSRLRCIAGREPCLSTEGPCFSCPSTEGRTSRSSPAEVRLTPRPWLLVVALSLEQLGSFGLRQDRCTCHSIVKKLYLPVSQFSFHIHSSYLFSNLHTKQIVLQSLSCFFFLTFSDWSVGW